ncbi:enoyl-CoA hydratase domain-containing protein 3, mitochondrial [Pseudonaja textilis]|uniref:Enoyl-CoA hydratase domain-containing protein 3, mitochondrial n=1 Tax=Pseudonaja textilis TaxID=8673 RepID=A0A670XLZ2_PSETE|nr:enoyl-CoA hydratase domain-containing protein 3, mitochondrial [Pseudonaja textilis]
MAAAAARGGLCGAKLARLVLGSRTVSTGSSAAPTPDGERQQEQQGKLTRVWQSEGIRNIVLSNPGKRNALSLSMLKSLRQDILHNIDSTDLRVIIISAEGPVFSSGHDLKELTPKEDTKQHMEIFKTCSEVMTLLPKLPVPVIAKVNGLATAAGCQLVASCDIAVASEKSKFATPGVNVGLFCSTPAVAIGRSLPKKVALEILFTGVPMAAQDALLHGLISRVVPEDQLESETLKIAQKICQSSRAVLALGKATFYKQMEHDVSTAYQIASQVMVENLSMKDGQEGIEAFVSKRKPNWFHS